MKIKFFFLMLFIGASILFSSSDFSSPSLIQKHLISGQTGDVDYDKYWLDVEALMKNGLPKSALKIVEEIYQYAKSESNTPQIIKSILYKFRLKSEYEEDFQIKVIEELKYQIENSGEPEKQILHSILAEFYWDYFQRNRYKFYNRSVVEDFKQNDISTWDLKKINEAVFSNYLLSLKNPEILKTTPLNDYDIILKKAEKSQHFRPTLYDLLAHRALDFFRNDENSLTKPVNVFSIDKVEYFSPAKEFIEVELSTKDSLSGKFYALKILRELIAFHINDENPDALIDVNLERLLFVRRKAIRIENEDSIYINSLQNFEKKYSEFPASANISYVIAEIYSDFGYQYDPKISDKYKWDFKTAAKICKEAIKKFPQSNGATNCKLLLKDLNQYFFYLTIEDVNIPEKKILGLLKYQNTDKLYFRIIRTNYLKNQNLLKDSRKKKIIKSYLKQTPLKEWTLDLINDGDLQTHSTEIVLPELSSGYFTVLFSDDPKFSLDNDISYNSFFVSNISFINQKIEDGSIDLLVLNRESGHPLKNVKAQTFSNDYDYKTREYKLNKQICYETDKTGNINLPVSSEKNTGKSFYIEFTYKGDTLFTEKTFNPFHYSKTEKTTVKTFFFTDRAIYRPGQTIYFKGIILENKSGNYSIKPNYKTTITFYDVNHQEVSKLDLISNEYGSINGSFIAPDGVLNGKMSISNNTGSKQISVEDYKLPKFEVVFDPLRGSYKLNENLTVKGKAKAYAGNYIDNAKVKYRVYRKPNWPYWRGYGFYYYYPSSETEILNGFTTTDKDGNFEISFKAIPDFSMDKFPYLFFDFIIKVDVTDINGETHSAEEVVSVGNKSLVLDVKIPKKVNLEKDNNFKIIATNLNGEPEKVDCKIEVYNLKQPEIYFNDRVWDEPDIFIYNNEEFKEQFPNQIYKDENDPAKWEKEKQFLNVKLNTANDTILKIPEIKDWLQGTYCLKISSTDAFGEKVENTKYFTLFSPKSKNIPNNAANWFTILKGEGEPGDTVSFLIGSKAKNVYATYQVSLNNTIEKKEIIKLSDRQKLIEIPIKEKYRGNFKVNIVFVKDNRIYVDEHIFKVPFSNKKLDLEFASFRNKLLPGQNEEWKIKIRNNKGEKVFAEMLAGMYDASLDAFSQNNWMFDLYKTNQNSLSWKTRNSFGYSMGNTYSLEDYEYIYPERQLYDKINFFGLNIFGRNVYGQGLKGSRMPVSNQMEAGTEMLDEYIPPPSEMADNEEIGDELEKEEKSPQPPIQIRRNFNETAFFYPDLETNKDGDVIIKFKIPETLTKWKFLGLAYTKELQTGNIQKELVTQKKLMVIPNAPRYFRQGDTIVFCSKVVNLSDKILSGEANLEFFDAFTMKPVNDILNNIDTKKTFSVEEGQSTAICWKISIPTKLEAITYRIKAKAENFSDGEENTLPVLTNRMLVTESLPLPIKGKESKHFEFKKLINSKKNKKYSSIENYKLSLEFTSNPAWYAIQALPVLNEIKYRSSDNVFSQFYANSIASHIINSNPKIKRIFDIWSDQQPEAFLSNLEKNQQLKSIILEQTPWVLQAKNESERKRRLAMLFDFNKMSNQLRNALEKLKQMQSGNGGWPWFEKMPDNRFITQYIICGFGRLDNLGITNIKNERPVWNMVQSGVRYLDNRITDDYDWLKEVHPENLSKNNLSRNNVHYLYARSYFVNNIVVYENNREAYDYYLEQATKYWTKQSKYLQGMIALALHRIGDDVTAMKIMKSLKEKALYSDEMGMYWRNDRGYYWYQAPIEFQALMIEAFDEITDDKNAVEEMKIWLLKHKQTNSWHTTKATTEACYALLLRGSDLLTTENNVEIKIGDEIIDPDSSEDIKIEAGTGYFQTSWDGSEIQPDMGKITVTKNNEGIAWGAVYWQYFEDLDKITSHETPLQLNKKLFIKKNSPSGPIIKPITKETTLFVGDEIIVRIEIRVGRSMEYVHMKDMRASAFEPVNVLSGYKYQGGLGYYESTRDAAVNFFFQYLNKGTYVFEYPLLVSQAGNFSNGITTIQCMYAPEFSSHSEGIRVKVKE
ncbi:MAG: hypothetical protein JEY97_12010 [Bacteroidales bacterium]|nr:hypothetical protein [Bacteroidales bacterium]